METKPSVHSGKVGRPRKSESDSDTRFTGIRLTLEKYQRIYRTKASLELKTGDFCGMGRLMNWIVDLGLVEAERIVSSGELSSIPFIKNNTKL